MSNYIKQNLKGKTLKAEYLEHIEDGIVQLNEEIAGQTSPEAFGAVGDGVTDDSAAITQALASGNNVVFDGAKTYAVGSVITIPADAHVDFRGATVVPLDNHDVIRVMPGSTIENLVVRCTNVAGWDSSAVLLHGEDGFHAVNPTTVRNVKLYCNTGATAGLTTQGVGINLICRKYGDYIEGVTLDEIMTNGFGIGMLLDGRGNKDECTGSGMIFIGANKIRGYWSFFDNCGISIPKVNVFAHVTNNIFTDLQIEPKNGKTEETQSSYGILCEGFQNYFEGCLYDYYHGHVAVYFGSSSGRNVLKSTAGLFWGTWQYIDLGVHNTITTFYNEKTNLVPYTMFTPNAIGNQDDFLAFLPERAECVLESLDAEPAAGNLNNVFNPSPLHSLRYRTKTPEENDRRAIITLNMDVAIRRLTNFYLQFYSAPKYVKVTFYNALEATVVYDVDNNQNNFVAICSEVKFGNSWEYMVGKIVIELGGFNTITAEGDDTYGEWELVRIMGVDSARTGNAWIRRDGGELYGNIKFPHEKGVVLTSESGNKFLLSVSDDGTLSTSEYIEEEEEEPEVAALIPVMLPGATWYNTEAAGVDANTITSVSFDASYVVTGAEDAEWACDEDVNGSIMAYRNGTDVVIKSTTGSEGVKLNPDSTYMFANDGTNANFANLATIAGTETLIADSSTSIAYICQNNSRITSPIHIPEGVTVMNYAFYSCTNLLTPPVLPDGLVDLVSAFAACTSIQSLPEIPASVTNLGYAFNSCWSATTGPSVIPEKVTNIRGAFRVCQLLAGNIEINAINIGNYAECFAQAGSKGDGITLTGSCPLLAELAATNTEGNVTVATA